MPTAPLRRVQSDVPRPAPEELLVAVRACGVCRTYLHLAEGDLVAIFPEGRITDSAAPHLWTVPVLRGRAGEPVSGFSVHRLGCRWRICRIHNRASGIRAASA